MDLLNKLFNRKNIECPRCLGKGEVDWTDIKRLNKELQWLPGKCAYCNGLGKVTEKMVSKIAADNTYLSTSISQDERKRLFNSNQGALQRANDFDYQINTFIQQIEYLHFIGNLDSKTIFHFYCIPRLESEMSIEEKQELLEYIETVINTRKKNL
jgi:excinuclease UvrABC ATPase subunit